VDISRIRHYPAGEAIIQEGAQDRWLYILINGKVTVSVAGAALESIEQVGEVFGEMAVLQEGPRSATVSAATDATVVAVDASLMESLPEMQRMETENLIYRFVCAVLVERLKRSNARIVRLRDWLKQAETLV
jgi:CRP-like cAMP-binding protein